MFSVTSEEKLTSSMVIYESKQLYGNWTKDVPHGTVHKNINGVWFDINSSRYDSSIMGISHPGTQKGKYKGCCHWWLFGKFSPEVIKTAVENNNFSRFWHQTQLTRCHLLMWVSTVLQRNNGGRFWTIWKKNQEHGAPFQSHVSDASEEIDGCTYSQYNEQSTELLKKYMFLQFWSWNCFETNFQQFTQKNITDNRPPFLLV